MTKYVLNSGGLRNNPEKGAEFLAEIVKDLGPHPRMLLTLFALPREYWEIKFKQYEQDLNEQTPKSVRITCELAFPDKFEAQIRDCDIVYMPGGDDHLIRYWLSKFDIPKLWDKKVVAGSSAGSDVLATHVWTCDWRQIIDGLGILPIKFLPHFDSSYGSDDPMRGPIDWARAKKELEAHGDTSLPVYALKEGDFVVIEQ